jgi:hypothetical protein
MPAKPSGFARAANEEGFSFLALGASLLSPDLQLRPLPHHPLHRERFLQEGDC